MSQAEPQWQDAPTESGSHWIDGIDGAHYVYLRRGSSRVWMYAVLSVRGYVVGRYSLANRRVAPVTGRPKEPTP